MRKGWIIALAIFLLIIGVALGISVYNKNKTDNTNIVDRRLWSETYDQSCDFRPRRRDDLFSGGL